MTKEQMIDDLTDDMVDTMTNDPCYAHAIAQSGFKGFENFTLEELKEEYYVRFEA